MTDEVGVVLVVGVVVADVVTEDVTVVVGDVVGVLRWHSLNGPSRYDVMAAVI